MRYVGTEMMPPPPAMASIKDARNTPAQINSIVQRENPSAVMAESTWSSDTGMTSQKMEYQEI